MYPKTEKKKPCHCILPNVLEVGYTVPGSEKYASLVAGVLAGMFWFFKSTISMISHWIYLYVQHMQSLWWPRCWKIIFFVYIDDDMSREITGIESLVARFYKKLESDRICLWFSRGHVVATLLWNKYTWVLERLLMRVLDAFDCFLVELREQSSGIAISTKVIHSSMTHGHPALTMWFTTLMKKAFWFLLSPLYMHI